MANIKIRRRDRAIVMDRAVSLHVTEGDCLLSGNFGEGTCGCKLLTDGVLQVDALSTLWGQYRADLLRGWRRPFPPFAQVPLERAAPPSEKRQAGWSDDDDRTARGILDAIDHARGNPG